MAATDRALGDLHKLVAESLANDLAAAAEIEDPAIRVACIEKARAQAITFLKNNSITADIESNDDLRKLKDQLNERRATSRRSELTDAMRQFDQMNPGLPS